MEQSIYSKSKILRGNKSQNIFYYLLTISIHLFILIILNNIIIENINKESEEELVYVKNLLPADIKPEAPAGPVPKSIAGMGNDANAGGGGGSKIKIDDRLIEKELEEITPDMLKQISPEDMKEIMPDKGDNDLIEKHQPEPEVKVKSKALTRKKSSLRQTIKIKKGKFGVNGGKGDIKSFESALGSGGAFGKAIGEGTGLGEGTGSGFGPGSGSGWGGGSGSGVGDGFGAGWQGGGFSGGDVDAIIKSAKIIKTTVRVFVLPDGSVEKVDVLKSSGFLELDKLAQENARQNVYEPLDIVAGAEEKVRIYDVEIEFSQIK